MSNMLRYDNSGFVMVTVIAMIITMMIVTVGIMSRHTTIAVSASDMVQNIQAKQIMQGVWWDAHTRLNNSGDRNGDSVIDNLDKQDFCEDTSTGLDTETDTRILNGTTFTYVIDASWGDFDSNGSSECQIIVDVTW